mgnify:CR=1 FL=1|tara:strand:- start:974 stop:1186 length:213 start_codon:yes stop_codon:yes gene_type:complete
MIGAIWKGVKLVGKIKPVLDAGLGAKSDIVALWDTARVAWDSDGDGKPDPTVEEAMDFLGKVLIVIAKRL